MLVMVEKSEELTVTRSFMFVTRRHHVDGGNPGIQLVGQHASVRGSRCYWMIRRSAGPERRGVAK